MSKLPNEITREVKDIMAQCDKISIQMQAAVRRSSDMDSLISEWQSFIDGLGNARYCTLQDLLDTDKALRERISDLEGEVSDYEDKIESLEDDHKDAIQELEEQITNMEVTHQGEVDELEMRIANLSGIIEALEQSN